MSELLLNQFEQDRALAALRYKNLNIRKLFGKSVFIAGDGELAFSLISSLLMVNSNKQAGMAVFLLVDDNEKYDRRFDFINSSDFLIVKYSSLDSISKSGDILIETGFLLSDKVESVDVFKNHINRAKNIISTIKALKIKETVILSNASVYGKLEKDLVISEKEKTHSDFSSDSLKSMLIQSVENLYFSAAHMYGFSIKVIRCGKIISANSNSEFVKNMLKSAVKSETLNVKNKSSKVSYISINDLISAVLFVACNGADCQAYNACSDDSTVNSAEFALALSDAFENCEVNITSEGCSADGCAVDCTRLKKLGWSSTVNYKDALLISGHEMMNDNSVFMFSDSYDGKLNDIQQILLGFLLEVDRICKKHNIKYFLGGGSLLGAVRHKGFIPWDDDADVMMLRKDYDRFLSILPSELPNYLFAQTQENEKDSHFPFTKLRINNTLLSTEFTSRFPNIHNGIFLDVLAQDYTSNNAFLRKIHMKATASSRWLVLDKWRGTSVNANSRFSSLCANILRKIFPLGFLQKVQNKLISLHKNMKNPKYLFDSMGRNVSRGAFPAEWLDEAIWVDFENAKLPIPKEYDKYLKYLYGDYMEMIPVSERHVSHDIKQIDLGEYAGYVCKDSFVNFEK